MAESPNGGGGGAAVEACAVGENGGVTSSNSTTFVSFAPIKPHLVVEAPRAAEAIHFYKRAFGAEEVKKSFHPKRKADQELPLILHAHLKFGSAEFMICDESEETGPNVKSPATLRGTTHILRVETNEADAVFAQAVEAGAKVTEEIADQTWGQRYGKVIDPFGFEWSIASPLKVIDHAEEPVCEEQPAAGDGK